MTKPEPIPRDVVRAAALLRQGDPVAALAIAGGRDDGHGLALRGIALAQLEEFSKAKSLLRRATESFRADGIELFAARAMAACAEVRAAERELEGAANDLELAAEMLERCGDDRNGAFARIVLSRMTRLLGRVEKSSAQLEIAQTAAERHGDSFLVAVASLARGESAARRMRASDARKHFDLALARLNVFRHPILEKEILDQRQALEVPCVVIVSEGEPRESSALELESWMQQLDGDTVVLDRLRRRIFRTGRAVVDLVKRPVAMSIIEGLASRWPDSVHRDLLRDEVFDEPVEDPSQDVRLRVAIGRVRQLLGCHGTIEAVDDGWRWSLPKNCCLVTLAPAKSLTIGARLDALLADGASWSARDLALAAGGKLRSVQRSLEKSVRENRVAVEAKGRTRRYSLHGRAEVLASQSLLLGLGGWD